MSLQGVQDFWNRAIMSDMPTARRWSYLYFSLALFVALGSQNFLTPVKSAVFLDVVGPAQEPLAKSLIMVVLVPCLILYSMIVSYFSSPGRLMIAVCSVYGCLFLLITGSLLVAGEEVPPWVAWILYYATETKGVIIMPMIWSIIAEVSTPDLAKKAYPIMFFVIQVGGIVGSYVAVKVESLGGEVNLLLFQILCFVMVAGFSWVACWYVETAEGEEAPLLHPQAGRVEAGQVDPKVPPPTVDQKNKAAQTPLATGLEELYKGFEGLWLLLSRPYVFMTFWVSYANLMPRTMLDYQNQVLAASTFEDRNDEIAFFGQVNLLINTGTAVVTLLGTRPLVENFGVGACLLVLPVSMFLGMLALSLNYSITMSTVSLVFVCIVAYGLNSPCKEMLYIRTSRDIKYKAKAWSEMYGNQAMKLAGAQMNLWVNLEDLSCQPGCYNGQITMLVVSAWVVIWLGIAARLGAEHRQLEATGKFVS